MSKVEKRTPKYLNLTESQQLLSKTINNEQRYKIRNYAITCIFLNCCLRLSELTQINLTDLKLDKSEQTLKVHGKGNKERLIYLDYTVCESINKYLEVRPFLGKEYSDYNALFLSSKNKRISRRTVQQIIKTEMNITFGKNKEGLHTHTLRHTSATLMYTQNNANILILKKILGHKSISSTEIYTHVTSDKMKYIMENCAISSILEKKQQKEVHANGKQ